MNIATDLDGTLSTGATWRGVGEYIVRHRSALAYRLFLLKHLPGVALAGLKLIDKQDYSHIWIADEVRLLKGMDAAALAHMGEWIVEHVTWPHRRQAVLDELAQHSRNGARVILVSGTFLPIAEAFARRAGIPAVVATPFAMRDGRTTGKLDGELRVKAAKLQALCAFLGGEPLHMAYGDTLADVPMLEMAATPVAVCPDARLLRVATERNWRIIAA
jgi:HAD superfamily phosphoserine phosphatase-like hydrolase